MRFVILPNVNGYKTAFNPAHVVKIEPDGHMDWSRKDEERLQKVFVPNEGKFTIVSTVGAGQAWNYETVCWTESLESLVELFEKAVKS